jgi:hypothetical protein
VDRRFPFLAAKPPPAFQGRRERTSSSSSGRREDRGGNVYHSSALDLEGWLCPALMRYFEQKPAEIYVQVKARPSED